MSDAKIVVGVGARASKPDFSPNPALAWRLFGAVGLGLAVVAYVDMGLGLHPLRIGDAQWEFGTFSRLFDTLPLVTMSTMLFFASAVARGRRWMTRVVAIWSLLFALLLVAALVLYLLTAPIALDSVTDPVAIAGLKKAIIKTVVQGIVYPAVFIGMGVLGLQKLRDRQEV